MSEGLSKPRAQRATSAPTASPAPPSWAQREEGAPVGGGTGGLVEHPTDAGVVGSASGVALDA